MIYKLLCFLPVDRKEETVENHAAEQLRRLIYPCFCRKNNNFNLHLCDAYALNNDEKTRPHPRINEQDSFLNSSRI